MNVKERNRHYLSGNIEFSGLFPQLEGVKHWPVQFKAEFGLDTLPEIPGLMMIRGARQMGKSTWLEQQIFDQIKAGAAGSVVYLNGDDLLNASALEQAILEYLPLLSKHKRVPKIFIDEITAVPGWEQALKRLYDSGETRHVLFVTTGSKAVDLRRGTERLPGRKGRLERSNFIFTPVSYKQFKARCGSHFKEDSLYAYMITGGSPVAINELILMGKIPEYVVELTKDWILGECALQERSRNLLTWVSRAIIARGGDPIPLDKLAKESGVANNTVVRGYIDLLTDLLSLSPIYQVDGNTGIPIPRKAQKYAWTNLLVAVSFDPQQLRTVADMKHMPPQQQAIWLEWLVGAELFRRSAVMGAESPELLYFWRSKEHELDYRLQNAEWLEIKRGQTHEIDFSWFPRVFPKEKLTVLSLESKFQGAFSRGITFEEWLLSN